jgi:hypothetical protein
MPIAMSAESTRAAAARKQPDLVLPRFDAGSESLVEWIASLRAAGVRQAGPALILALESLRRADVSPSRRFSVLHLLKAPIMKTCAGLPKPRGWGNTVPIGAAPRGVTAEQRLYRLMFQNLDQALRQLDRCYFMLNGRQERRREWAVRNLFRFFDRQIRYTALWGGSLPENAWRDLHELFAYLRVRREPRSSGPMVDAASRSVDPEREYKQILLFGLAARLAPSGVRSGELLDGLRQWALETYLEDTQDRVGEVGALVVELLNDIAPYRHSKPLAPEFRGWILVPPAAFLSFIERDTREARAPRPLPDDTSAHWTGR